MMIVNFVHRWILSEEINNELLPFIFHLEQPRTIKEVRRVGSDNKHYVSAKPPLKNAAHIMRVIVRLASTGTLFDNLISPL